MAFSLSLLAMFTPMASQLASAEEAVKTAEVEAIEAKSAAIPDTDRAPQTIEAPKKIINTTLIAEVDTTITVTLDGETLQSTEVHRTAKGELYVNAKKSNSFNFKLDPRLKVATGFDIIVNGLSLGNLNPEPKSIGPVLIMPLLPIAEALGHDVTVIDATNEVRVRRAQDSAEFTLNLDTGLRLKARQVASSLTWTSAFPGRLNRASE